MAAGNADHTVQSTKLRALPLVSVSKIWEPRNWDVELVVCTFF